MQTGSSDQGSAPIVHLLDEPTRALVVLAASVASGGDTLAVGAAAAAAADVPVIWGDELMLQSLLMVGYPRALAGAAAWREATGAGPASDEDGTDFSRVADWADRGERTCRAVYGENYAKLRANVAALHPSLDAWMVREGYGRTLSRPGLDLVRREFCVVAQMMVLEADRQLHSHLRGALNAGASGAMVDEAIDVAGGVAGPRALALARTLRKRIG